MITDFGWEIDILVSPYASADIEDIKQKLYVTEEEIVSSLVSAQLERAHADISEILSRNYPYGDIQDKINIFVTTFDETKLCTCLIVNLQTLRILVVTTKEARYIEKTLKSGNTNSFNLGWVSVESYG